MEKKRNKSATYLYALSPIGYILSILLTYYFLEIYFNLITYFVVSIVYFVLVFGILIHSGTYLWTQLNEDKENTR